MSTIDKETLRDVFISVLNTPIPQTPAAGSIYDILRDLDKVLPHSGKLVIVKDGGEYKITLEPK